MGFAFMSSTFREFDIVRVAKLNVPTRIYNGTTGVSRAPRVGDEATICHQYAPDDPSAAMAVEMVDRRGMTIWLADFLPDELEFVSRAMPRDKG